MNATKGKVYLVGSGPGDPGLITVKGLKCLSQADVVVYDSLANPELLASARPDAELIFVGKRRTVFEGCRCSTECRRGGSR